MNIDRLGRVIVVMAWQLDSWQKIYIHRAIIFSIDPHRAEPYSGPPGDFSKAILKLTEVKLERLEKLSLHFCRLETI